MKPTVILIPVLIVLGGVVTALLAPLPPLLRGLIVGSDCFVAVAVGLILWRRG